MTILNRNYRIESGEHGAAVITITGRCTADELTAIEAGCCRRYSLVPIPNSSGVVFKALDGSNPALVNITPSTAGSTIAKTFTCVKVDARCNPMTAIQTAGPNSGKAILSFMQRYQEVDSVA